MMPILCDTRLASRALLPLSTLLCGLTAAHAATPAPLPVGYAPSSELQLPPLSLQPTVADLVGLAVQRRSREKWSVSDVLTSLVNIDGVRIIADNKRWNSPDMLAIQRSFRNSSSLRPFLAIGIDRAVYLDAASLSPVLATPRQSRHAVCLMAEAGTTWHISRSWGVSTSLRWADFNSAATVLRTNSGLIGADQVTFTMSVTWRPGPWSR